MCACLGTLKGFRDAQVVHGPDRCYTAGREAVEVTVGRCPKCRQVQKTGAAQICDGCAYREAWVP